MHKQPKHQQLDHKRRLQIKERLNLLVKERKVLLKHLIQQQGPSANLCSQLKDKAKHTAALIQEITEELQAIEEESVNEEHDSNATQIDDLEQEDSDMPLTEDDQ